MPALQAYYAAHAGDGFTLVGLNVSEDAATAAAFAAEQGLGFPIWSDPPGNVMIALRVRGLPASLLVDADGRVAERWVGPLTVEALEAAVTPLLQETGG
jgi:peroxiredoxin